MKILKQPENSIALKTLAVGIVAIAILRILDYPTGFWCFNSFFC